MLQELLKNGLSLADNIMIGVLSQADLAGVTLANQPYFILAFVIFGLGGGGAVLISQYFVKKDYQSINNVISILLTISISVTALVTILVLGFPGFVMR
jgi:Na+-driven multidrug efflux pump